MVTARLGQMVTLSPRRLAEQPGLRARTRSPGSESDSVRVTARPAEEFGGEFGPHAETLNAAGPGRGGRR
jgi:hypothetical protein